jgi:recombinational DNA repair protein RecR
MFDLEKIIYDETSNLVHFILNNNIKYIDSYELHNILIKNLYNQLGDSFFSIVIALKNNFEY